ncbi:PepSY domain-containing protein [Stappia taiwanensis]|uniref:NADPH--hemoprotein reductase n=1 Tax=Stappia taiwanensis TaxID=992267 RepID=A0A838XTN8_9HYPH|nr:PepSY domain-containing protein [Stappia taiwanensis]MBA4613107.1 PepSY domain-containing protein [Stappia taiwanensis]GGF01134.1 NADPH flavoprotein [Stappia taiwanensis]
MLRSLHKIPGLVAAALILLLATTGVVLSVLPALETAQAPAVTTPAPNTAELAARVAAAYPGVEQIRRAPSGLITAFYFENDRPGRVVIDPVTGEGVRDYTPSAFSRWMTNLHRSLFLDDGGRLTAAAGALAMLVLCVSGCLLTVRRVGGWRRLFSRLRGPLAGRLHVEIARIALPGLLLSSLTALVMTAGTFGVLPSDRAAPLFPTEVSETMGAAPGEIAALAAVPLEDLRELTFPYPGDATDVFTLKTVSGTGYLDQGTGAMLVWADHGPWQQLSATVKMLHTGRGAWVLGLVLGLTTLGAPVLAVTGIIVWLSGRRARPRLPAGARADRADTIVLVGSEGGSTWGFAATLHKGLMAAGHTVHTAALSRFAPERYTNARQVIILASTYGDGAAPSSAQGFADRLAALPAAPAMPLAVLGFGDRQFPDFCGYACEIARLAEEKGWPQLLPLDRVDRQSPQDFARWGRALGQALGHPLELAHQPALAPTHPLTLISRRDYGAEMQAPTSILRFALPSIGLWQRITGRGFPSFAAGDLLGILPEGSAVPRFYSLASASRDGFVEICVKKHTGGLCSGQLIGLRPGGTVRGFIRRNPDFRPVGNRKPVILIGAGTGIGPLAGFARANRKGRDMHLYFGARHPKSDLLYDEELRQWQANGRLTSVNTAFSRTADRSYVQDILRKDAARITDLIEGGAQVLVCGGREMASGVTAAMADILQPKGLTPATLKAEGRYVEDVY